MPGTTLLWTSLSHPVYHLYTLSAAPHHRAQQEQEHQDEETGPSSQPQAGHLGQKPAGYVGRPVVSVGIVVIWGRLSPAGSEYCARLGVQTPTARNGEEWWSGDKQTNKQTNKRTRLTLTSPLEAWDM